MRFLYFFVVESNCERVSFEFPHHRREIFKMTVKMVDKQAICEKLRVEQECRLVHQDLKFLIKKIGDTALLCALVENESKNDQSFYRFFLRVAPRLKSERAIGSNRPFRDFVKFEFTEFNLREANRETFSEVKSKEQAELELELKIQGLNKRILNNEIFEVMKMSDLTEDENAHIYQNKRDFNREMTKHLIFGVGIIFIFLSLLYWHRSTPMYK